MAHLTERHRLFIILAIGESVVAIGVGAAEQPISAPLLVAAILGVAAGVCLWWLYFDVVSLAAGIVLAALGVEGVLAHAGDRESLGTFYALPLFGGVVLYLTGQLLFKRRMHNALSLPRLVTSACSWPPCQPPSWRHRLPAGRVGAHPGCPDRRRDHSVCPDPTQPPWPVVASQPLTRTRGISRPRTPPVQPLSLGAAQRSEE